MAGQGARALLAAVALAVLLVLAACGGSASSGQGEVSLVPLTPSPSAVLGSRPATPTVLPPRPTPTPTPTATPTPSLTGFIFPLEGACLPSSDNLMPNAPRPYRAGIHEGIDFYPGFACAAGGQGAPVLAAKDGVVIRADWDFVEMTPQELQELLDRSQAQGYTDPEALDRFRGRQVWIDHGGGVVTRYAHLGGIAPGIDVGVPVKAGQVVGYVGNSGTPDAVIGPGDEMHLHFEIRVGDSYLGAGLPPQEVRALLERAFSGP